MTELYQDLIRYASLAPSGHNTQPWKFQIVTNGIRIIADTSRRLPIVDPTDREIYISLGCALENLLLAAAHAGFEGEVTNFPAEDPTAIFVRLSLASAQAGPLFDAIPRRQSTRSLYDGRPVPAEDLNKLKDVAAEPGTRLHIFTQGLEMETLIGLIAQGNRIQFQDKAFVDELVTWIRFNDAEAVKTMDGLFSKSSGNPAVPRFIGQVFIRMSGPDAMARADEKKLRSSAGLALFTSASDDPVAWVNVGRLYERFALTATNLKIKLAFMNQPVEIDSLRTQLSKDLGLDGSYPQLLVRFGYAAEMPRSLRRPLEQILTD